MKGQISSSKILQFSLLTLPILLLFHWSDLKGPSPPDFFITVACDGATPVFAGRRSAVEAGGLEAKARAETERTGLEAKASQ